MTVLPSRWIRVHLDRQEADLLEGRTVRRQYPVSTALNGPGEEDGSFCTPRGWHVIRARIGAGVPEGGVFRGRRWTGEVCTPSLYASQPDRDWILTRILWLCGREPGRNRFGRVDTMRRYIYFHGTPDAIALGVPGSRGCIRMRNSDMLDLFDVVSAGMPVWLGAASEAPDQPDPGLFPRHANPEVT
ncbi:L,D-transpeptidase [Aquisalimonas asiatica]|uniref:L,D-transpeptidase catalytic domain n=1 Tax=Aquisalimonas asiatica TaxID=406100 RepID=A0A1H8QAN0_9GAMM|nr:L,D-transpeptidase [Aquisalimonas asiatica]SEO50813.1 L,D-transpeptidase catalytic domain [Aquisalimonas asiatica]